MSVKILLDSSADMIPEVRERVEVLPLTVRFGDEEFADGVTITTAQFYEKLAAFNTVPATSQVPPADFEEAYKRALQEADEVLVLTLSSDLSGTYQSAMIAAAEYEGKVYVVDSRSVALGTGVLAQYALELVDLGMGAAKIAEELASAREKVRLIAVLDTLEYLKKGGRISKTVALAGGLLSIKPIVGAVDGELKLIGKARGSKQANALLNQEIEKCGGVDFEMPALLGYSGISLEGIAKYLEESAQFWNGRKLPITSVGCAVGCYTGPGAVAIAFFAAE